MNALFYHYYLSSTLAAALALHCHKNCRPRGKLLGMMKTWKTKVFGWTASINDDGDVARWSWQSKSTLRRKRTNGKKNELDVNRTHRKTPHCASFFWDWGTSFYRMATVVLTTAPPALFPLKIKFLNLIICGRVPAFICNTQPSFLVMTIKGYFPLPKLHLLFSMPNNNNLPTLRLLCTHQFPRSC